MTVKQLRKQVNIHLKRHLLYADEKLRTKHCETESDQRSIVVNELEMASQAIYDFRIVRFWPRMTAEANKHTIMMQCFCHLGHKFCFCHHCWVMQILLDRGKS